MRKPVLAYLPFCRERLRWSRNRPPLTKLLEVRCEESMRRCEETAPVPGVMGVVNKFGFSAVEV